MYKVYVTVYHSFEVEADSEEEARLEANHFIWDDYINDVNVEVEKIDG